MAVRLAPILQAGSAITSRPTPWGFFCIRQKESLAAQLESGGTLYGVWSDGAYIVRTSDGGRGATPRLSTEAAPMSVLLDTVVVSISGRFRQFLLSKITSSPPTIPSCAIGPIPTCS